MSKLRSQLNNLTADPVAPQADPVAAQNNISDQVSANMRAIEEGRKIGGDRREINSPAQAYSDPQTHSHPQGHPQAAIDPQALANTLSHSVGENLRQQMSDEIDKMCRELATLQQNASATSDRAILSDIERISASIHELQTQQSTSSTQVGDQVGELAGELAGMHREIRSLAQNSQPDKGAQDFSGVIQNSYNEIAQKLDDLGSSDVTAHIATLSEKLELFKENIPASDPQTLLRFEGQLQSLGEGITLLVENTGAADAASGASQAAQSLDANLPEYFEKLEHRLDEITRAVVASAPIENSDGDEAFDRIEARIASLAKSVDNLSIDGVQAADNSQLSDLIQVPDQLRETLAGMEQRMSEISMSAISGEVQNREDFSGQIDALVEKIDQLQSISSNLSPSTPIDGEVGTKLDSMSLLLERAINSGDGSIGQLDKQISELSTRIDSAISADAGEQEARQQSETQIVEELKSIVERVDSIDPTVQNDGAFNAQLSALEVQMAGIASQLGSINTQPDLSAIESRLGGIEEQFAATRDITIEAANHALQQSANNGNSDEQAALISSLAEELKNLSKASSELQDHSFETFDAVRESLATILDRINGIELRMADYGASTQTGTQTSDSHSLDVATQADQEHFPNTEMVNAARNYAADIDSQNDTDEPALPTVAAPPLEMRDIPEVDNLSEEIAALNYGLPGDDLPGDSLPGDAFHDNALPSDQMPSNDLPLEPGSGAPDMGALVRQAKRNKREQTLEDSQQNPTDFIAAARRAAQAAANEAKLAQDNDADNNGTDGDTSIKQKLSRKKKLMFFGAAIILLAALAIPAKKLLPLGGSDTVIEAKQNQEIKSDALSQAQNDAGEAIILPGAPDINSSEPQELASNVEPQVTQPPEMMAKPEADSAPIDNQPEVATLPVETPASSPVNIETQSVTMPPPEVGPVALRLAAFNGNPVAMFEVGRRYTDGINGAPDFTNATKWYELAAKANHAPAQYRLGNFNEKGHGGDRDVKKAAEWYRLAADQGNALAMHNLAVIHAMGVLEGGADLKQASMWFGKAANLGVKDSQVNLGIVYAKAMGVEANYIQAYKWFAIAAKAGDKDAAQKRDTIAKQMHEDQLKQARGEVELWRPQELNQAANSVDIPTEWNSDKNLTASLTSSDMVIKTQTILAKLGYDAGSADGLIGDKTTSAIRDFQKHAGITVNGMVTPELISALEKANP